MEAIARTAWLAACRWCRTPNLTWVLTSGGSSCSCGGFFRGDAHDSFGWCPASPQPPHYRTAMPSRPCGQQPTPPTPLPGGVSFSLLAMCSSAFHALAHETSKTPPCLPRISSAHWEAGWGKRAVNRQSFCFRLPTLFSFPVSVFYLTRDGCRDERSWNIWGNRIGLSSPCNKQSGKFLTQIASWLQI